ncbi:hypothetical protein IPO96_00760 [Candidatus Saccharibacteria bacterium]|nr:MAG: hypothetical protein IPO96_00760 [Candidatus Saccharibacteria bacterium]
MALVTGTDIASSTITTSNIATSAITSTLIADNTITAADINTDAVTSDEILDGTITSADIANGTIATVDITDGAVTLAKLANCSSDSQILKYYTTDPDGAGPLAAGWNCDTDTDTDTTYTAGTGINISGGNVISSTLGTSIESSEITDGEVSSADIANGTITFADIASNSCNNGEVIKFNGTAWYCGTDADSDTVLTEAQVEAYIFDADNTGTLSSGTLALGSLSYTGQLTDTNISDALTISSSGSVADGALSANVTKLGQTIESSEITDGTVIGTDIASSTILFSNIAQNGCGSGDIMKWNGSAWACATDATGGGAGNSFETIAVSNGTNPVADSSTDTLTLSDGAGITITGNGTTDTLTIAATLGTSIDSSEIVDGTIVAADIADATITNAKLVNSGITVTAGTGLTGGGTVSLGGTVTLTLLNDFGSSIDSSEITNGTITGTDIASSTITTSNIATSAITSTLIADNTITAADINTDAVTSDEILDGTITSADIANGTIATVDITDGAVTLAKLANCSSDSQILKYYTTDPDGAGPLAAGWNCDTDTDTDTTYTAGTGINISGGNVISSTLGTSIESSEITDGEVSSADIANGTITFADIASNSCNNGEVIKFNGTAWYCGTDADSDTVLTEAQVEAYIFDADNTGTLSSGTLALGSLSYTGQLTDTNISDALTISSSGSVADGALSANVTKLGQTIESSEITDGTVIGTDIASSTILFSNIAQNGCSTNDIMKWNGSAWACATDATGGGAGNSFETIAVSNGTNPVADSSTDTLT